MRETWTTSLISEYDFLFFFFFKMKRQMLKCQMLSAAYPRSMMNAWRWFRTCCREPSRKWKSSRSLIETANHVAPSSCCTTTEIPLSISVLVSIFDQHTARKKKGKKSNEEKEIQIRNTSPTLVSCTFSLSLGPLFKAFKSQINEIKSNEKTLNFGPLHFQKEKRNYLSQI